MARARKVDEALDTMDAAAAEWWAAARKVLRYGNLADMEQLLIRHQNIDAALKRVTQEVASDRMQQRFQREVDRAAIDALTEGRL